MKETKIAFALNSALFVLEVFAAVWMWIGIGGPSALSATGLFMLGFFTVDSNVLMGVIALVAAIDEWQVLKGKKQEVSRVTLILKLMGTVGVALTMLVTVCFLLPTTYSVNGLFGLFRNSNFFLHLANPILAIVVFVCFERSDRLRFRDSFAGLVPLSLYTVFYAIRVLTHLQGGTVERRYDPYGFFFAGMESFAIVIPAILIVAFAISVVLWRANRIRTRR